MGDSRRFNLFADFIGRNFNRDLHTADVAGGCGKLQTALRQRGFESVVSWDKRHLRGPRRMFKYGYFDYRNAPLNYELIVGLHSDQGTDHCIAYAVKHRVPFCICPCCVLPSAVPYQGYRYEHWISHLEEIAARANFRTVTTALPMSGRNIVIAGWPIKAQAAVQQRP